MRGVLVLVFLLSFAVIAPAQTIKENAAPRPGTVRVAVVNVAMVFHKYAKARAFKQELDVTLAPFKGKAQKLTQKMQQCKNAIENREFVESTEEELHALLRKNQREYVDLEQNIKRLLGQKQEENLLMLWKEVHHAIRIYSNEHGIELVFGYGEPLERELLDLFPNVNRKMQALDAGSTIPLFMAARAEIGDAVAELLNRRYREKQAKDGRCKQAVLD